MEQQQEASCHTPGVPREPIIRGDYIFNTGKMKHFTTLDYVIFVSILCVSTFIGFYQAWRGRTHLGLDEYFLASRSMHAFPVSFSLMVSFTSALLIMGTPAEIYMSSTMYFWIGFTYVIGTLIAAFTFIPVFYRLNITSVYEYLEMRFSRSMRTICSSMYIIAIIIYLAVVMYAPSVALQAVTGLDLWGSILTVGTVCTLYTAAGGMKAVIWTDVFQSAVTFLGLLVMLIRSISTLGGFSNVLESAKRTNRISFFDFRMQPSVTHTVWSTLVGGSTITLMLSISQAMVMRCMSCRTLREATKAQMLYVVELVLIFYICFFIGLDMSAFYENCDPLRARLVDNPIQMSPLYMMDILGDTMGLQGLYLACLISVTLSSISSGLNSVAAVMIEDYIKVYVSPRLREKKAHTISQVISIVFGIVCLEFTFAVSKMERLLQSATSILEMIFSPILGIFILGAMFPMATTQGAVVGLVAAVGVTGWLLIGKLTYRDNFNLPDMALRCVSNCNITAFSNFSRNWLLNPVYQKIEVDEEHSFYNISYLWFSPIAVLIINAVGLSVSYCTGFQDPKAVDPKLIIPLFDVAFPLYYLPESTRKYFRFGIDHEGKYDVKKPARKYTVEEEEERFRQIAKNFSKNVDVPWNFPEADLTLRETEV